MAYSAERASTSQLESFIEQAYNTTVNMAGAGETQQSSMELYLSPVGNVSTPLHYKADNNKVGKRKAQSPLTLNMSTNGDNCGDSIDVPLKHYLDEMTITLTNKITESSGKLEQLITKQGSEIDKLHSDNDVLDRRCQVNEGRLTRMKKVVATLEEHLVRNQQQAMKENLVFQNIPETQDDNTLKTLMDFMVGNLKINANDMSKIRVTRSHRMGNKGRYPRSIVAKINDDGRNVILGHTKNLKGQKISVYTQMPRELVERRKQLVPLFKDAREKKLSPKWFGDKLQIGERRLDVKPAQLSDINVDTTERACQMQVARAPPTIVEGSSFQGSKVSVLKLDDVIPALHAIYADHRVARATHNIYRIHRGDHMLEYYNDDGEHGAGRRLLELLRGNDVNDTLVCVTRWYGGKHLGPERFNIIVDNAKQALQY
jgi:hypothetical protein